MTLPESMRETSYNVVKIDDLLRGQNYLGKIILSVPQSKRFIYKKKEQSVFLLYASCIQFTDIIGWGFEIYRVFAIKRVFGPL